MIQVDISNIWCDLSLRDLLGVEQDVFRAHMALSEPDLPDAAQIRAILTAAERIRAESDALIVIGDCPGARGAIELLQGTYHNLIRDRGGPQIFFTGTGFSTRDWNQLMRLIEGKDISLCVIGDIPAAAVAFRNLRWLLERKYGTDEARQRVYAVSGTGDALQNMASEEGWETFARMDTFPCILSPADLLPMAAAGIDIQALLQGLGAAQQEFDLRSYDNPVWLYTAARVLLYRKGRSVEILSSSEPELGCLGNWWQQIFGICEGPFPSCTQFPAALHFRQAAFRTMFHFDAPEQKVTIVRDAKNLDDLNHLAGQTLDQVEETVFLDLLEAHTNAGIPIVTIDCGPLNEETLGQLFWFFRLSSSLCARLTEKPDR